MREIQFAQFCVLALGVIFLVLFSWQRAYAEATTDEFLQCGGSFPSLDSGITVACTSDGPQAQIVDKRTKRSIRDATIIIEALTHNGEVHTYEIHPDATRGMPPGSYRFCSLTSFGLGAAGALATSLTVVAPGYRPSQTWRLDQANPCQQGGFALGTVELEPLPAGAPRFGCYVQATEGGSCKVVDASSSTPYRDTQYSSQAACAVACGSWYLFDERLYLGGSTSGLDCRRQEQLPDEVQRDLSHPAIKRGPFPVKEECTAWLDSQNQPTQTPTPGPTHTPAPAQPPCAKDAIERDVRGEFSGCRAVDTGLGIRISTQPDEFIRDLFGVLLSISGGVFLLILIGVGYSVMTSQGDPEKLKAAKERLTSAVVGLLFLIFSLVILEVIGVDILRIPGFCHAGDGACQSASGRVP